MRAADRGQIARLLFLAARTECSPYLRAAYGVTWTYATTSPRAPQIIVAGLTPDTIYQIRLRAVDGSTGFSNWSDPVSHMAT